nr:MAG TPA: hypothetical protein [Caudoviricetes sp.]
MFNLLLQFGNRSLLDNNFIRIFLFFSICFMIGRNKFDVFLCAL